MARALRRGAISRQERKLDDPLLRAANAKIQIGARFGSKQKAFLDFVLSHYVSVGVDELDQEKLTPCFASNTAIPSPTPSRILADLRKSGDCSVASRSICMRKRQRFKVDSKHHR
jgi:hypothetical protein